MQDKEFLDSYFKDLTDISSRAIEINRSYFEQLLSSFRDSEELDLRMFAPESDEKSDGLCVPFALIPESEREFVAKYQDLKADSNKLIDYSLVLCKMHAGLGTSVVRKKHMLNHTTRSTLGSKGTDLFIRIADNSYSLAELQFIQMKKIIESKIFKTVKMLSMVNRETMKEVRAIETKYQEDLEIDQHILQLKVPTIDAETLELTKDRLAPAGHGLVGFHLILDIFLNSKKSNLITIGNGEDLNSTADEKVMSWMVEENIPVTMITTTKLECDKKGGQISRCEKNGKTYFTIVEKAQAEKAGQLSYFEKLGLRENDFESLFNTNIVVINTKALKEVFDSLADLTIDTLKEVLAPTLIKNSKKVEGHEYIQLEGALGSVMLNLDRYFRLNFDRPLITFLNLSENDREKFFLPIKTIDDFDEVVLKKKYCQQTGRLISG